MTNNQSKTKTRVLFLIAFLVFSILVVFATIYDYKVSNAIANPELLWTKVLDVSGEMPALLFTGFNMAIIIEYLRKNDRKCRNLLLVISYILIFICGFYPVYKALSFAGVKMAVTVPVCVVGGAVISAIFLAITRKFSNETLKKYINAAFTCVGIALSVLIIISLIKFIWGRPRFYSLDGANVLYSPWYIPKFFSGNKSFPSGHTSNATMIIMLAIYFPKQRKWLCPLIGLWIVTVAVSRVFAGAHFMTDVLFGCALTLLICYIWCKKTGAWSGIND